MGTRYLMEKITKEQKAIRRKAAAIDKKLDFWHEQEKALRDRCPHIAQTREHRSNTGNWCPHDDLFWADCKCADCGRIWTEWKK